MSAAPRCACGNFTSGQPDGLCNACRAKNAPISVPTGRVSPPAYPVAAAEKNLSFHTTPMAMAPQAPVAGGGHERWKDTLAWCGPALSRSGMAVRMDSAAMEGRRYWPGEGVITKYPNGCQDRCFTAAVEPDRRRPRFVAMPLLPIA